VGLAAKYREGKVSHEYDHGCQSGAFFCSLVVMVVVVVLLLLLLLLFLLLLLLILLLLLLWKILLNVRDNDSCAVIMTNHDINRNSNSDGGKNIIRSFCWRMSVISYSFLFH